MKSYIEAAQLVLRRLSPAAGISVRFAWWTPLSCFSFSCFFPPLFWVHSFLSFNSKPTLSFFGRWNKGEKMWNHFLHSVVIFRISLDFFFPQHFVCWACRNGKKQCPRPNETLSFHYLELFSNSAVLGWLLFKKETLQSCYLFSTIDSSPVE